MSYFYVKSDYGTCTDGTGAYGTKQTGAFAGLTSTLVYDSLLSLDASGATFADGDEIVISDAHNKTHTVQFDFSAPYDLTFISVDDGDVEVYSIGAKEYSTSSSTYQFVSAPNKTYTINGLMMKNARNITFNANSGAFVVSDCTFEILTAGSYYLGTGYDGCKLILNNCTLNFNSAYNYIYTANGGHIIINNLKADANHVLNNTRGLLKIAGQGGGIIEVNDTDFDALVDTGEPLISESESGDDTCLFYFNRCKTSASPIIRASSVNICLRVELNSCDSGDGYHYFEINDYSTGDILENETFYLTYSADNDELNSSIEMSSSDTTIGNPLKAKIAEYPAQDLTSANTYTVNFVTTDATSAVHLSDTMFWIEAERNDATNMALGVTQSSRATDNSDNILAGDVTTDGATEHDTNTESWSNLLTDSNKYEDSLTVAGMTGVDNGTVTIYAYIAEPNISVYVDPAVVIT